MQFRKATKKQSRLRLALVGPTGSGKTYTALRIARGMGGPIAFIDTERGSASLYSDDFDFEVLELESFHPKTYCKAIKAAEQAGYPVLIIDSLTHAWSGKDGALEQVDKAAKRSQSGNSFTAWRDVTPLHNELVDTILQCKCHVIVTMRSKMEYVLEDNGKGKKTPRKIGLAPVQRDGMEYEFTITADIDTDHNLCVAKTRMRELKGYVEKEAGEELGERIMRWLESGEPEPTPFDKAALAFDGSFGVTREQLLQHLNRDSADSVTAGDLNQLKETYKAIDTGSKTVESVFGREEQDHVATAGGG